MNYNSSSSACMKMSQRPAQVALPSTHSGEAFIDFVYDMLQYTITKENLHWIEQSGRERTTEKVFNESFGDAVLLYHQKHVYEFNGLAEEHDMYDIIIYVTEFCEKTFKADNLLREFIRYCAFLFDIGSLEIEFERPYHIYPIVDRTADVFNKYLKSHFTKLGGWDALFREADEYVKCPDTTPETTDDSAPQTTDDSSPQTTDDSAPQTTDSDESASDESSVV